MQKALSHLLMAWSNRLHHPSHQCAAELHCPYGENIFPLVKFEHPMFIFQSLDFLLTAMHLQKEPVSISSGRQLQIATQKHLLPSLNKINK